jgi:multidrug resistance efflux pump
MAQQASALPHSFGGRSTMRQVRDTLIWLAMIMVIAGVIYAMPRVASYVAAPESDQAPASINYSRVSAAHEGMLTRIAD